MNNIEIDIFEQEDYKKKSFKDKSNLSESDKALMALYNSTPMNNAKPGDTVDVTYIGSNNDYFMFEGGFKDYVRVDNRASEAKYLKNTNIGDSVEVVITTVDEDNFIIRGSIATIYETRIHETLKAIGQDEHVVGLVKELTPAGYSIEIYYESVTLDGFMPNTLAGINKLHDPESIIGKQIELMIESYSRDEGTYIVSRRKYLQSLIPHAIKALQNGVIYGGHVTGTTDFGVFVEFNDCLTGMIHKTNLNPEYQTRMSEIRPGMDVEFYIKEIIKDKIILTQILRESLWDTIKIGQVLDGKVKDNKQFGSLIILDEETIGLVHTSELEKSSRRVTAGESVKVKVISVDRMNRKIFLSLAS
jgi:small subunit ribosomal protein S1